MENYIRSYLEDNGYLKDGYEHYASAEEIATAMRAMQEYIISIIS